MNPAKAQPEWPPVVVGGAFQTGIMLMKHLVRAGLEVCAFDSNPRRPGFHTRYGKVFLCPNPDEQPDEWLRFMLDLAKRVGRKPVLIPTSDQFLASIAKFAGQLREHFIFTPSIALQAEVGTKDNQYDIAERHGFPTPRTRLIGSLESLEEFMGGARFPCLLKPLSARHWDSAPRSHPLYLKKVMVGETAAELAGYYALAREFDPQVVVQEVITGPDTAKLVYLSCYDRNGKRLGSCVLRELRTDPMGFGSAGLVEPLQAPDVDALCDAFVQSLGYTGLCELELKRDSRDGQVRLIEINPRYSVTADAAPYAGVNLGWLHYLDLNGEEVEPVRQNSHDYRHVVLQRDLPTLSSYRKAGLLSWKELRRSYRPPVYFFDLDVYDWQVTARTMLEVGWKLFGRPWMRRFIPKG
jgi:predicted ATP-grasp superfamily ATP-dependent carboligase